MSNFLQRVAATVIQPKAKLQPMMGSIFAPSTLYSPAEPFTSEIVSQTVAPHRHEPIHSDGPDPAFASPMFASHAFESEERLFPASSNEVSPSRSPAADQPLLHVFDSPEDRRGSVHPHPLVKESAFESSKSAANQPAAPTLYQPLIAASQSPPPRLQPLDSPSNSAGVRSSRSEAPRRFQPTPREADDIHIHIGRIEVTAVAQPAPRPAAAAARRSLNLDEYLRRGNGWRG